MLKKHGGRGAAVLVLLFWLLTTASAISQGRPPDWTVHGALLGAALLCWVLIPSPPLRTSSHEAQSRD